MADTKKCSRCGAELPPDAPGGHCPRCLLNFAVSADAEDDEPVGTVSLSLPEEISPSEKPGDRIGRYKLLQQIGEGGMGTVWMAEQTEPVRRKVALKVVKLGMDTKQVVARFEAERQALALMDHPNIAKVLDAGATMGSRPYFVMELVRGIKITDYCDQKKLSTEERLNLFIKICQAIQHAHQKGVIHRDIKPSNILVTISDGTPVPKVIDFGIAKATSDQPLTDKTLFTAFDQFIGTPAYMSPEQAEMNAMDVDTRSDIYSLGVLLYELLTGKTPLDAKELLAAGLDAMRRMIREQEPPRPSTRLSAMQQAELTATAQHRQSEPPKLLHFIKGDLDWIVMKALEKDRARRYESANGLAMDLTRFINSEPVLARPPSNLYRLQKLIWRNKLVFATTTAVSVVFLIGFAISIWSLIQEREARRQAEAAVQKARAEDLKSQQVTRFLTKMLQGVEANVAMGRDTAVLREVVAQTETSVGEELKGQPEAEAELRAILGNILMNMRELPRSETNFQIALNLRQQVHPGANAEVATSMCQLAHLVWLQGRYAEAEILYHTALEMFRKLYGEENTSTMMALEGVGITLGLAGKNSAAESIYRRVLAFKRRFYGTNAEPVARTLCNLGEAVCSLGAYGEAEQYFQEALTIYRVQPENQHFFDTAYALAHLGHALQKEGKNQEAEAALREVVDIYRKFMQPEDPTVTDSLRLYAAELRTEGKYAEAETQFREALEKVRKHWPNDPNQWKACEADLADILKLQHKDN